MEKPALTALREGAKNFETIFDFLPEKITLNILWKVQETIGHSIYDFFKI